MALWIVNYAYDHCSQLIGAIWFTISLLRSAVFPLILVLLHKCRKRRENIRSRCENTVANHKQQCHLLEVLCDLKQTKKKVIADAHRDCQQFSFLYWSSLAYFKTIETKKVFR